MHGWYSFCVFDLPRRRSISWDFGSTCNVACQIFPGRIFANVFCDAGFLHVFSATPAEPFLFRPASQVVENLTKHRSVPPRAPMQDGEHTRDVRERVGVEGVEGVGGVACVTGAGGVGNGEEGCGAEGCGAEECCRLDCAPGVDSKRDNGTGALWVAGGLDNETVPSKFCEHTAGCRDSSPSPGCLGKSSATALSAPTLGTSSAPAVVAWL